MPTDSATPLATPEMPLLATGPLMLVVLVAIGVIAWWIWRRRVGGLGGAQSGLRIEVLATRPLGPRSHLAVVETAGVRSLIATTAQGVTFLRDLPREEAPAAPAPSAPQNDFAQHLGTKGEAQS